jgi:hypothetical protein
LGCFGGWKGNAARVAVYRLAWNISAVLGAREAGGMETWDARLSISERARARTPSRSLLASEKWAAEERVGEVWMFESRVRIEGEGED